MPRRSLKHRSLKHRMGRLAARAAIVIQAAVPGLAVPARADPPALPPAGSHAAQEILYPRLGDSGGHRSWLGSRFHLQKKSGFAYTHRFQASEKPVLFRIQGPVMKKQKALGLTFKIHF